MQLEGKVAHVTGAAAGIGRAIALHLARVGAAVAVSDVDPAGGSETVKRIEAAGGRAAFFRSDVSVEEDVEAMIRGTEEALGGLDVLVNNAGGAPEPYFPEAEPAHWVRQVGVNLLGVMFGTWYGIGALRRRGGGAIVNVSSTAGLGFGSHAAPEYAAGKAGIWRFTATLASLAEEGIRVNCIVPDWVQVESMRAARLAMGDEEWAKVAPLELVQPEEIAEVALLLVENDELAGRVVLCPQDGPWGLIPLDEKPRVEPLPGLARS
jgi:NAD(P)-dependent dehydrogenase (short-subunit alcohol dehydrogenase family)